MNHEDRELWIVPFCLALKLDSLIGVGLSNLLLGLNQRLSCCLEVEPRQSPKGLRRPKPCIPCMKDYLHCTFSSLL